jgi:hypothetical protein
LLDVPLVPPRFVTVISTVTPYVSAVDFGAAHVAQFVVLFPSQVVALAPPEASSAKPVPVMTTGVCDCPS